MSLRGKSCCCAVLLPAAFVLAAPSAGKAVEPDPNAIYVRGPAALDITRALRGALHKLENPACQQILDDYTDREGRPLRENLQGATPVEYLARLAIRDGEIPKGSRRCASPGASAFTAGGAAVFVCSTNFRTQPRGLRENAFIHEMLHTLGLRENPPSSAEITRRVTRALRELKGLDSTRCRAAWPGVSSSPPPSGESSLPARRPRPGSGRRFRA
jgi:hypothetical protein